MSRASWLMCRSSVWLKKGVMLSYAAGILDLWPVFSSVNLSLCLTARLYLAVPVRLRLSASEVLMPELPK